LRDIVVAAVSMESSPLEMKKNLDKTFEYSLAAKREGAEIVCFPELSITGYLLDGFDGLYVKEGMDELVEVLKDVAAETGIVIMAGLVDVENAGRPMIAHFVFHPDGRVMVHRKTHLSQQEKALYGEGNEVKVFEASGISFGIQLCYEGHFPELSSIMALLGAEVIFFPHASPRGTPDDKLTSWSRHLTARAYDNSLFVVACNQVGAFRRGVFFPGVALILGPDGKAIACYRGKNERMLLAELRSDVLKQIRENSMRFFLNSRRPELYKGILSYDLKNPG